MISDKTNAISLAPAPTFAIMALLTRLHDDSMPAILCSAAQGGLDGMLPMYLLMAVFHSPPWLSVIRRWRKRRNLKPAKPKGDVEIRARRATRLRPTPPDSSATAPLPPARWPCRHDFTEIPR
jgi:hypothetical protein